MWPYVPLMGRLLKKLNAQQSENYFEFLQNPFFKPLEVYYLYLDQPSNQENKTGFTAEQLWFLGHRVESTLFAELQRMTRGHDFTQAKYRVSWRVKIPSLQLQSPCILASISFPKQ